MAYLGEVLTDPLTKNQSLITTIMEVFSNILREDLKRASSHFLFRQEKFIGIKGDFIRLKQSEYPIKQFRAVSLCCYSYLSCYHRFYFHLKTGVNTPRTLYTLFNIHSIISITVRHNYLYTNTFHSTFVIMLTGSSSSPIVD